MKIHTKLTIEGGETLEFEPGEKCVKVGSYDVKKDSSPSYSTPGDYLVVAGKLCRITGVESREVIEELAGA